VSAVPTYTIHALSDYYEYGRNYAGFLAGQAWVNSTFGTQFNLQVVFNDTSACTTTLSPTCALQNAQYAYDTGTV